MKAQVSIVFRSLNSNYKTNQHEKILHLPAADSSGAGIFLL